MANEKRRILTSERKKGKNEKKKQRNIMIFVIVVAVTMLLSGLTFFGSNNNNSNTQVQDNTNQQQKLELLLNSYKVKQIGNFSVLIEIKNVTRNLIAMPSPKVLNPDRIISLLNLTIDGIKYITCDSTGLYFLCTFNLEEKMENNATNNVKKILDKKFKEEYSLARGLIGKLPTNISGTDEVYIVSMEGTKIGDFIRAKLFQKETGGVIGFEEKIVPPVEMIPAKVRNITSYSFTGTLITDFDYKNFSRKLKLNSSQLNYNSPKFVIENTTFDNDTRDLLNNLTEVSVTTDFKKNNITTIVFNKSFENITNILAILNITDYKFENGTVGFRVGLGSNVEGIKGVMSDFGIVGIDIKKDALVSFPPEIVSSGKLVTIEKSDKFPVTVELKTNVSDNIFITMSIIQFGEQIIPIRAREVTHPAFEKEI